MSLKGSHIVFVAHVPFFVATQLSTQIEALLDAGNRVTVITSPGPELDRLPQHPQFRTRTLLIPRKISPLADLRGVAELFRLLRELAPDILHSTTPKGGLLSSIAGFLARVPVRLHSFTGQPWLGLHGALRLIARQADWLIGRLSTHVYADSPSQAQFLVDEGLLHADKISVIGDGSLAGVDIERFDRSRIGTEPRERIRRELGIPAQTTVFLFIGRITREKGIHELLEASRQLHASDVEFSVLLLGPMDDERGGEASVSRSELTGLEYLHYLGYSAVPEDYLAAADVLCLPSYREGFGTVVIEAAAMSLPTIGTRINGLIDAVAEGETGLLVPVKNAFALADAMRILIEDPAQRERLGQQARERVEARFSSAKVSKALLAEYRYRLDATRA